MAQSTSDETLSTFYVITTQLHVAACPQLLSLKYWDQSNATFFAWIILPSIISGCHVQNLPVIQCSHTLTDLLTDCYQAYCLTGQLKKKKKKGSYLVIWACLAVAVLFLLQMWLLQILICIHSITLPFTLNSCIFPENWGNTLSSFLEPYHESYPTLSAQQ